MTPCCSLVHTNIFLGSPEPKKMAILSSSKLLVLNYKTGDLVTPPAFKQWATLAKSGVAWLTKDDGTLIFYLTFLLHVGL
jgi:hypothetical protein